MFTGGEKSQERGQDADVEGERGTGGAGIPELTGGAEKRAQAQAGAARQGRAPVLGMERRAAWVGGPRGSEQGATKARREGCDIVRAAGGRTAGLRSVQSRTRCTLTPERKDGSVPFPARLQPHASTLSA